MSEHSCVALTAGCYRCDLNRDEIADFERERREKVIDTLVATVGVQMPRGKTWRPGPIADALLSMLDEEGYL